MTSVNRMIWFSEDGPEGGIYIASPSSGFLSETWPIPAEVVDAYEKASAVWDAAQKVVMEWFEAEQAKYPEQALELLLTDNLSRAQFDQRVAGCVHPSPVGESSFLRCNDCGRYRYGDRWQD